MYTNYVCTELKTIRSEVYNYVCTEYACAQIKQAFALRVLHFCCTVMYVCSDCNASKAKDDGM